MSVLNQPSFFDSEDSRVARDVSIDHVAEGNQNSAVIFERCAREVIRDGEPFTTDDILMRFPELEEVKEKRVFGAVLRQLCRSEIIKPGGYRESDRKTSHARPKRIWIPESRGEG